MWDYRRKLTDFLTEAPDHDRLQTARVSSGEQGTAMAYCALLAELGCPTARVFSRILTSLSVALGGEARKEVVEMGRTTPGTYMVKTGLEGAPLPPPEVAEPVEEGGVEGAGEGGTA